MSIKVMTWVFEYSDTTLGARLVLLALADYAQDDGSRAFPSVDAIALKARVSQRAARAALRRLEEEGHIETMGRSQYGTTVYRVLMGGKILPPEARDTSRSSGDTNRSPSSPNPSPINHQGSSTKSSARGRAPLSPAEEVEGFGQWLGQHVVAAEEHGLTLSVPRAATARRTALHRTFVRLRDEGMGLDEFELASRGVLGDEWMRDNGHVQPESVLRVEKVGKWVDAGRALAEAPAGKYAHLEAGS